MKKTIENNDRPLMKNVFITDNDITVDGWYGCEQFEIHKGDDFLYFSDRESFNRLYDMMTEMKKELDK